MAFQEVSEEFQEYRTSKGRGRGFSIIGVMGDFKIPQVNSGSGWILGAFQGVSWRFRRFQAGFRVLSLGSHVSFRGVSWALRSISKRP